MELFRFNIVITDLPFGDALDLLAFYQYIE